MGSDRKLVFAYGTTMHGKYMRGECPKARLVGVGKLKGWKWVINSKKYANIVESSDDWSSSPSGSNVVYGLVYALTPHDFHRLGRSERHRSGREKAKIYIKLKKKHNSSYKKTKVYVWFDSKHESGGHRAHKSYRHRMEKALKSARHHGVPKRYIKKVEKRLRKGTRRSSKASLSEFTDMFDLTDSGDESDYWGGRRRRHWDTTDFESEVSDTALLDESPSRRKKSWIDDSSAFTTSWW